MTKPPPLDIREADSKQAAYDMGVADERERCEELRQCAVRLLTAMDDMYACGEALRRELAAAIRKGE